MAKSKSKTRAQTRDFLSPDAFMRMAFRLKVDGQNKVVPDDNGDDRAMLQFHIAHNGAWWCEDRQAFGFRLYDVSTGEIFVLWWDVGSGPGWAATLVPDTTPSLGQELSPKGNWVNVADYVSLVITDWWRQRCQVVGRRPMSILGLYEQMNALQEEMPWGLTACATSVGYSLQENANGKVMSTQYIQLFFPADSSVLYLTQHGPSLQQPEEDGTPSFSPEQPRPTVNASGHA